MGTIRDQRNENTQFRKAEVECPRENTPGAINPFGRTTTFVNYPHRGTKSYREEGDHSRYPLLVQYGGKEMNDQTLGRLLLSECLDAPSI